MCLFQRRGRTGYTSMATGSISGALCLLWSSCGSPHTATAHVSSCPNAHAHGRMAWRLLPGGFPKGEKKWVHLWLLAKQTQVILRCVVTTFGYYLRSCFDRAQICRETNERFSTFGHRTLVSQQCLFCLWSGSEICPEMHANEMHELYDRHYNLFPNLNSY